MQLLCINISYKYQSKLILKKIMLKGRRQIKTYPENLYINVFEITDFKSVLKNGKSHGKHHIYE